MKLQVLSLITALLAIQPLTLHSEPSGPPEWIKEITRLPPGGYANLRPVHLDYTLDWNNRINAGEFQISIAKTGETQSRFVGDANGRSTGFARLLWPYDFRARSLVDEDSLRPLVFQLREVDRSEESSYDIIFEEHRQVFTTTSKKRDEEARTATNRFSFDFGQDVLSSAFYLRSHSLKPGEEVSMVVTPFNKPYLAHFTVMGSEERKIKGKRYRTIKLDAKIGKVNTDLSIKTYDKIKKTTLWVSDDEYRIPLELQSQLSLGFVSARLDDLKWLD